MTTGTGTQAAPSSNWLRQFTGLLSSDLNQQPGEFGLGQVPARLKPDAIASSVCGFCSTGCSLDIHLRDNEPVNLTPSIDYPVNLGMACPKGWEALTPLSADDRATTPLLFNPRTNVREPVDWDHAMQVFALRFKAIQHRFGRESVAWLGTGQIPTEELAFLGALGKFGMGIRHGDSNTRQCMATSAVAYKQSFGFDAPPYTYADFEDSDAIVLIGSNLAIAHPILWQRVLQNKNRPEIIVVDPRKTETAMAATKHYAIKPKSDLVLFYGLARLLIDSGSINRPFIDAHTSGFDSFAAHVHQFSLDRVAEETGLTGEQVRGFAESIQRNRAVSFWWTMGINQGHESTRTAQAIIALALMTGNIGRPGTGANSITGQCNAMGSRLFSNTSALLGGRDFSEPTHRREVAEILGIPFERIPKTNSLAYDQILDAIDEGTIRGLWIVATNTAHSWIHQERARKLLCKLDFLVVQDMYHSTETAQLAHLSLPAAGWGEKEGTFINSERRIGVCRKVKTAPGHALSDFNIFRLASHYWGCADLFARWTSPSAAFEILKQLSRGRPCDFSGIQNYGHLECSGGIQWPLPDSTVETAGQSSSKPAQSLSYTRRERRLFADGKFFTPDGRALFLFATPQPMPEKPDSEFPFLLLTGRGSSAQWHTQTRTSKSAVLRKLYPQKLYAEIHPLDAKRLGIGPKDSLTLTSRRGSATARAFITPTVNQGEVFLPLHYESTNCLTYPAFDPHSRQPSYKACAVAISKANP